jgi:hypothetical protein
MRSRHPGTPAGTRTSGPLWPPVGPLLARPEPWSTGHVGTQASPLEDRCAELVAQSARVRLQSRVLIARSTRLRRHLARIAQAQAQAGAPPGPHPRLAGAGPGAARPDEPGPVTPGRQQLAELAAVIAGTEERIADTFDRLAQIRPEDAGRLRDMAAHSRRFAESERQQAAEYVASLPGGQTAGPPQAVTPRSA